MREKLIAELMKNSEEEQRILGGGELEKAIYTRDDGFVVNGARIGGSEDIFARLHTRYTEFPNHTHSFLEMMTVQSGSITHKIQDRTIYMKKGDIIFINKHLSHSINRAGEEDLGVNVIFSDRFIEGLSEGCLGTVFEPLFRSNLEEGGEGAFLYFEGGSQVVENLVENILIALTYDDSTSELLSQTVALLINSLCLLTKRHLKASLLPSSKSSKRSSTIITYIRTKYRAATLDDLAKLTELSVPYLSVEIKKLFGVGFTELLIRERIKKADGLITGTNMKIGEIIRSVGYENESYFHREYKKQYGVTPLQRRRRAKQEKGDGILGDEVRETV